MLSRLSFRTVAAPLLIALVLGAAALLLFYRLGAEPFQDYDEATYAETTAESLASHDFLSFTFLGVNDFRKPPLLYWLMGPSKALIASPEIADRVPSALAALALIGMVMVAVYAATGNAYAAAAGGGVLLATSAFIEPARQVRFDILVSLFDLLSVYAFYRALDAASAKGRRWFLACGAFLGLAVLSKGPLVLYAIVPMLALAAYMQKWRWLRDPYLWGGALVALTVILPWHLYETVRFGWSFWEEYLGDEVLSRVTQELFSGPTNLDYLIYLFGFAAPWAELLCAAIVAYPFVRSRLTASERAWFIASLAGAGIVLLVSLITPTKAVSYLIPLYPFMTVALVLGALGIFRSVQPRERKALAWLAGVSLVSGLWFSVYNGLHIDPYYSVEMELAQEEHSIGTYLASQDAATFYIYDTTKLGSIMFYSGIVQPKWMTGDAPPAGSYVLYQTAEAAKLKAAYPSLRLAPAVAGSALTLAEVF